MDEVILSKRRFVYEEELKANQHNYDIWFDYIRLEEAGGRYPSPAYLYRVVRGIDQRILKFTGCEGCMSELLHSPLGT